MKTVQSPGYLRIFLGIRLSGSEKEKVSGNGFDIFSALRRTNGSGNHVVHSWMGAFYDNRNELAWRCVGWILRANFGMRRWLLLILVLLAAAAPQARGYVQALEEHVSLNSQPATLSRVYNYGLDLISQRDAGGTVYYFIYDGLGSTRLLTTTNGAVANVFAYDAYGTLIASNGVPQTVYLFAGEQWDANLGFYYLRARYLNTGTGRFWTRDSFEGNQSDPLSLHRYLYAHGNPVMFVDPSGNKTLLSLAIGTSFKAILAGAVIGGVISETSYYIRTPVDEWSPGGALASFGKGAGTGAIGSTVAGAAFFAGQAVYEGMKVWRDPNATGLQKALASANILIASTSAILLKKQVNSQILEWKNVYSKIPLSMEVQRDLSAIRQAFNSGSQSIKFGNVTIRFSRDLKQARGLVMGDEIVLGPAAFESEEWLMRTIIEENFHLMRIRNGLAQSERIYAGMEDYIRGEEKLADEVTEDIFKIGRERGWW